MQGGHKVNEGGVDGAKSALVCVSAVVVLVLALVQGGPGTGGIDGAKIATFCVGPVVLGMAMLVLVLVV